MTYANVLRIFLCTLILFEYILPNHISTLKIVSRKKKIGRRQTYIYIYVHIYVQIYVFAEMSHALRDKWLRNMKNITAEILFYIF